MSKFILQVQDLLFSWLQKASSIGAFSLTLEAAVHTTKLADTATRIIDERPVFSTAMTPKQLIRIIGGLTATPGSSVSLSAVFHKRT